MSIECSNIQELLDLEDIEECEMMYSEKYGYFPFNISTWNPSEHFANSYLHNKIELKPFDYVPYIYSYELETNIVDSTKRKLGGTDEFGCLITNTGTSSISLVTSVLKQKNVKRILLICPVYYSVLYNLSQKEIIIKKVYLTRTPLGYRLPRKEILDLVDDIDAIWFTNPIYNTGEYLGEEDINFLKNNIPPSILLICDDCFASSKMEMIRHFREHPNYISIHDPLKQIMVNGLKFSCILYSMQFQNLFEQWSDIICGSLSYSSVQSLEFYNSEKFDTICLKLHSHFKKMDNHLAETTQNFPLISIDNALCYGHMRMAYISHLPFNYLQDKERFFRYMEETGTSLIPGNRFHFSNKTPFCFRINYGRECPEFWDALIRIFIYFSSKKS